MTKYKTSELDGALLDAAVAQCGEWKNAHEHFQTMTLDPTFIGWFIADLSDRAVCMLKPNNPFRQDPKEFSPSTDWNISGLIIDRERIGLIPSSDEGDTGWYAKVAESESIAYGPTALVSAMKAFVLHKLGEEVEL